MYSRKQVVTKESQIKSMCAIYINKWTYLGWLVNGKKFFQKSSPTKENSYANDMKLGNTVIHWIKNGEL